MPPEDCPNLKKRITISIDEKLLDFIDNYIEKSNYKVNDRSHLITITVAEFKDREEKK